MRTMERLPVACLCLLLSCSAVGSADSRVVVFEDSDVILPCSLSTKEDITLNKFDWRKDPQKDVFLYDAGLYYNNGPPGQDEQFKGRIFHFPDELQHGNASIIIRKTKVADSGNYTCDFQRLQKPQTFHIELVVGSAGSRVDVFEDSDVILPCSLNTKEDIRSKTFDWTKDPQGKDSKKDVFLYDEGLYYDNGLSGQDKQFEGRVSHFPDELQHGNASIIINKTKLADSGKYTCDFPRLQPPQTSHIELVVGSRVVVFEDSDVILPCSLSTKENITSKTFDWTKDPQGKDSKKDVFLYDEGLYYDKGLSGQDKQFEGRVSHFPDELQHGNASIIIRKTKVVDSGKYTCQFPHLQPRQTFHIELVVAGILKDRSAENIPGVAAKPSVKILHQTNDQALLQCKVKGASPKPKIKWRDSSGNILPAGKPLVSESGGSFNITIKTTVNKTDTYRCVATQEEIYHEAEAHTYVYFRADRRVVVVEDSDVILPCSLNTKEDIRSKLFDWTKDPLKDVFLYDNGSHYNNGLPGQDNQFRGRVSHFPDELQHGNASIIIRKTKLADSGNYTCDFPNLQPPQTSHIELVVGAAAKPSVKILHQTNHQALLQCEVKGASPKPKIKWRDSSGNILPAGEPLVSESGGSFNITIKTTVTKTDTYHCVATQEDIYHEAEAHTYVYISGSTWFIVAVLLCILLVVAVVGLAVLYRKGCIILNFNRGSTSASPREEVALNGSSLKEATEP